MLLVLVIFCCIKITQTEVQGSFFLQGLHRYQCFILGLLLEMGANGAKSWSFDSKDKVNQGVYFPAR